VISDRDKLSKTAARTVAIIQEAVPYLASARDLPDRFDRIIQNGKNDRLPKRHIQCDSRHYHAVSRRVASHGGQRRHTAKGFAVACLVRLARGSPIHQKRLLISRGHPRGMPR
jgi:hypothetical protein